MHIQPTHTSSRPRATSLAAAVAIALAAGLAACDRNEPPTVGQQIDRGMAEAERRADAIGSDIARAGDTIAETARDAAITAKVNAELARDDQLSALRIDVDTSGGRVALEGTAPSDAARERATQLASGIEGVVSVDNRLRVEPKT